MDANTFGIILGILAMIGTVAVSALAASAKRKADKVDDAVAEGRVHRESVLRRLELLERDHRKDIDDRLLMRVGALEARVQRSEQTPSNPPP